MRGIKGHDTKAATNISCSGFLHFIACAMQLIRGSIEETIYLLFPVLEIVFVHSFDGMLIDLITQSVEPNKTIGNAGRSSVCGLRAPLDGNGPATVLSIDHVLDQELLRIVYTADPVVLILQTYCINLYLKSITYSIF